tara:strand:+ start:758 stop:1216 length:459 start_codon:yes stop_codon:yes gene_type:complete
MLFRVLLVFFSLTFLANGCLILTDKDCNYIDMGGTRRVIEYSCQPYKSGSDMSGSLAGWLGLGIGMGMIFIAVRPALRNFSRNSRSTESYIPNLEIKEEVVPPRSPPLPQSKATINVRKEFENKTERNFCSSCGTKVEPDDVFCSSCGKKLK